MFICIFFCLVYCSAAQVLQSTTEVTYEWKHGLPVPRPNYMTSILGSPGARIGSGVCGVGSVAFVFGGSSFYPFGEGFSDNKSLAGDLWSFDIDSSQWRWHSGLYNQLLDANPGTAQPGARYKPITSFYQNRIYLYGGYNTNGVAKNDLWCFSLFENKWNFLSTSRSPGPFKNPNYVFDYSQNILYMYGGIFFNGTTNEYTTELWQLNITSTTWTKINTIGSPPSVISASLWKRNTGNSLYLYGGINENSVINGEVWKCNLSTLSWSRILTSTDYSSGPPGDDSWCEGGTCNPGFRFDSFSWIDSQDNIMLYGGATDSVNIYSDIWRLVDSATQTAWYYDALNGLSASVTSLAYWSIESQNLFIYAAYNVRMRRYTHATRMWSAIAYQGTRDTIVSYPDKEGTSLIEVQPGSLRGASLYYSPSSDSLLLFSGSNYFMSANLFQDKDDMPQTQWSFNITSRDWDYIGSSNFNNFSDPIRWVYNGSIYIFGGRNALGSTSSHFNKIEIGTVNVDMLSPASLPFPRYGGVGWVDAANDSLWLFGGSGPFEYLDDLWQYQVASNTWIEHGTGPSKRAFPSGAADSDYLFLYGGLSQKGDLLNDLWQFVKKNQTWIRLNSGGPGNIPTDLGSGGSSFYPTLRLYPASAVINGSFYIFGGIAEDNITALGDVWEYDTKRNMWFMIGNDSDVVRMNQITYNPQVIPNRGYFAYTATNEGIYVYGGSSNTYITPNVQQPTILADLWFIRINKTMDTCGNGQIEAGEECDGGVCCTTNCRFAKSSQVCNNTLCQFCLGNSPTCPTESLCPDACSGANRKCDYHVDCTNTIGGYICGNCPQGMEGSGYTNCTSICGNNECEPEYGENCVTCKRDCNRTTTCQTCGDNYCDRSIGEDCKCVQDCGLCDTKTCPGTPVCSGHGTCLTSGSCVCTGAWSGPDCSKANVPITTNVSIGTPGVVISPVEGSTVFVVVLQQLQELDASGKEVYSIFTQGMNFTLQTNSSRNKQWEIMTTLENRATLIITIYQFEEESTPITFANTTTNYIQNSVKIQVEVRKWPFRGYQNSLALVFETQTNEESGYDENCNDYVTSEDANGNVNWVSVYINGRFIRYGQFETKAILDEAIRVISFSTRPNRAIAANIPHFWDYMVLDPTFNVLLGDPECNDLNSKSKNSWRIAVAIAVPVGVVLIIAIAVGIYFLAPKMKTWQRVKSEKKNLKATELANVNMPSNRQL